MLATITSFATELAVLPIIACIFHYTGNPNSPQRLFYSYPVADARISFCAVCVSIPTLLHYYRESKKHNNDQKDGEQDNKINQSNNK